MMLCCVLWHNILSYIKINICYVTWHCNGLYHLQLIACMQILYVCKYKYSWIYASDWTALTRFLLIDLCDFHSWWIFCEFNVNFVFTELLNELKVGVLLRKFIGPKFSARLKKVERKIANGCAQKHSIYTVP